MCSLLNHYVILEKEEFKSLDFINLNVLWIKETPENMEG